MSDFHVKVFSRLTLFLICFFIVEVIAYEPHLLKVPSEFLDRALRIDSADRIRLTGSILGAVLSAAIAIGLYMATFVTKRRDENRELELIKFALWQDLRATLKVIFFEYEYWADSTLLKNGSISGMPIEQLRPTVFDKVVDRIGELSADQAFLLLLVHDNLRLARELIEKFAYQPGSVKNHNRFRSHIDVATYRDRCQEDANDIAETLKIVCGDSVKALAALDRKKVFETRFLQSWKDRSHDFDEAWFERLLSVIETPAA
jgi:hypothetical protein